MNYNVKVACENQAKVINFTIENSCLSTNTITQVFNGVVKDNYTVSVGLGCKKHRGKAVPFIKAIAVVKQLRFFKYETVSEYEEKEDYVELLTLHLPYCSITTDIVNWGTFFKIDSSEAVDIKPDMSKIAMVFESKGLDIHLATSGSYYTHHKIKFVRTPGISSSEWKLFKAVTTRELHLVHKKVAL